MNLQEIITTWPGIMAEHDILQKLDTEGADIRLANNGAFYWIAVTRHHGGHRYSHSVRLDTTPTDEQIANVREMFSIWWSDTIRDQ